MKGYLSEKSGKYYVVVRYKDNNDQWKTKWISTGLSTDADKTEAEKVLVEKLKEFETPAEIDDNITIITYINNWLKKEKDNGAVSELTYDMYESLCRNHIVPFFQKTGNKPVNSISTENLQEFINYESKKGNRSLGKGKQNHLSPKSVKHLKNILNLIFKEARREKLITDDPCEFLVIPKQVKRNVSFFDNDELSELFSKLKEEELYPLIYVTVFYGLRRSEVLGIKWDSIDFKRKTLSICHSVVKGNEIIEKDTTKNDSSYRTFPLSPEVENIFMELKAKEQENKRKYKSSYIKNDYVFKQDCGQMYRPDFITRKFSQLLEKYDMPHIRFHDLRHSCASLLISQGYQLKDVQEWLGHADISTTANIYAHLDQTRKMNIMAAMETLPFKKEA